MDYRTDLIIVGGGAAGLSAAVTATESGLSVLLLEKEAEVGGSSLMSGGSLCFAGTDIQAEHGVEDSEQLLYDDLRRVGGNENEPDVVRAYTRNQKEVYDWLRGQGVPFASSLRVSPGNSRRRTHTADPATFIPILLEKAVSTNLLKIVYGARTERLIIEPHTRRVIGAEVGGEEPFMAYSRHGVVLASGGFTRAPDLIRRFAPAFSRARFSGGAGNTGDGLLMAWKLGADILDVAFIQGNYGTHPEAKGNAVVHAVFKGAIAVNSLGNRYVDESVSYKRHSDACMAQPGQVTYQVFDQKIFERGDDAIPTFSFKSRLGIGEILSGSTVAELAAEIGVPVANLEGPIERYNANVEAGRDADFGREAAGGGGGPLVKIDEAPYYAYPSTVVVLGTYCGIRIDGDMRVIDVLGEEIAGLYAAGEIVGGFHGRGEIPGAALGKALVFGRLAARNAYEAGPYDLPMSNSSFGTAS